ncbi:uncharacterized protein LOC132733817 [Ruditapes philippinarum]|uniref:uncharacterized protein LOC132733817 n=1 Tax=Ruditapes philippinarum TaxID=129788 RepID=UPI00295A9B0D|nr:uncharacterized protein LOC132733817 [Ruditapes philippinarum]
MNSQRISSRNKEKVDYKMLAKEGVKVLIDDDHKIEDKEVGAKPKKSKTNSEKILSNSNADKPDEVKSTKSPSASKQTGKHVNLEKKAMLARLNELDEQQRRLEEQRELNFLRKQILEREAFVSSLEKSVSAEPEVETLSPPKSRVNSERLGASRTYTLNPLGSTFHTKDKGSKKISTGKKTRIAAAFDSPSNQKG